MTKTYAKIEDGVLITTCAPEEDADLIAQLMSDGFKPYDLIIRLIGSVVNIWQSKKPSFCVYF